jgi:hypothetical protein
MSLSRAVARAKTASSSISGMISNSAPKRCAHMPSRGWEPMLYDAMVLAASVEFADRATKRPSRGWARRFDLRIPVHDPARWAAPAVSDALHEALRFLTGDFWSSARQLWSGRFIRTFRGSVRHSSNTPLPERSISIIWLTWRTARRDRKWADTPPRRRWRWSCLLRTWKKSWSACWSGMRRSGKNS